LPTSQSRLTAAIFHFESAAMYIVHII